MKTRKKVLLLLGILAIGIAGFVLLTSRKSEGISIEVFEVSGGYGYLLKNEDKVIIRQEVIPAIEQMSPFCSYGDARAVASLVRQKMLKKELPAITKKELKALHVQIKCLDLVE